MRLGLVLKGAALALAVGVVALVAAAKSTDPARTRDEIAGWLSAMVGQPVRADAAWHLSLGVTPRLWAENIQLSPHISLKRVDAELSLWPLLRREVRITRVVVSEPRIDLNGPPVVWHGQGASLPPALQSLREVKIKNGVARRVPAQGMEQSIGLHRLILRPLPGTAGRLSLDFVGDVNGRPLAVDGQLDNPLLTGGKPWSVRIKGSFDGMAGLLDGQLPGGRDRNGLDVKLSLQADDAASAARLLGWDIPPVGPMKLSSRFSGDLDHVQASDLDLVAGRRDGWRLTAKGGIGRLLPLSGVEVLVQAERDGTATGGWRLSSLISGGGTEWSFADLRTSLGQVESHGALTLSLAGARPRIGGSLAFDRLDVSQPSPLTVLWSGLDGQLALSAKSLIGGQHSLEQVSGTLTLGAGRLRLAPFSARALGGSVAGSVEIDHSRSPALLSLVLAGDGLDAAALLRGQGDKSWQEARAALRLTLNGRGDSMGGLLQSLGGTALLTLSPAQPGGSLRCAAALFQVRGPLVASTALVVESGKTPMSGTARLDLRQQTLDLQLTAAERGLRTCRDVTSLKTKP